MTEKQALRKYVFMMMLIIVGIVGVNLFLFLSGILPEDLAAFIFLADVAALVMLSVVLYVSIVKKRR